MKKRFSARVPIRCAFLALVSILMMAAWTGASASVLALPEGTRVIEEEAFYGDTGIDEVLLPEGIERIGARAFAASSLTRINLPSSLGLDSIADDAFDPGVTIDAEEGTDAYRWAVAHGFIAETPLTDFAFTTHENGTCDIRSYTGHAERVVIPETYNDMSVTKIGKNAFAGNTSVKTVVIPYTVSDICEGAFDGCAALENVEFSESPNLWTIEKYAFRNCTSLRVFHFPYTVNSIAVWAFDGCTALEEIDYPVGWSVKPNYGVNTYSPFTGCDALTALVIPEGVSFMPDHAFDGAGSLREVILPSTMGEISKYAFRNCALETIDIPESVQAIHESAFEGCSQLREVSLREGLSIIEMKAFAGCAALEQIAFPTTLYELDIWAFDNCGLKSIVYPIGWSYKTNYGVNTYSPFTNCPGLTSIEIPERVTAIVNNAFDGMTSLVEITLPSTMATIGSEAFRDCTNLNRISFPAGLESICDRAFYGCSSLEYVFLSRGLTSIGSEAFARCTSLKGMTIPSTVIYISYNFVNEYAQTDLYVPRSSDVWDMLVSMGFEDRLISWDGVTNPFAGAEDSRTVVLVGTVSTPNGEPLQDVVVSVSTAGDPESAVAAFATNRYGEWQTPALPSDEEYAVAFLSGEYDFASTSRASLGRISYTTVGTLRSEFGGAACSFEITQNGEAAASAVVGTVLDFEVTAPGADSIRLVVDDIVYETYPLDSGEGVFHRAMTKAGDRRVRLIACSGSETLGMSEEKTISILSDGDLEAPSVTSAMQATAGEDYLLTWDAVEHADSYVIYLYHQSHLMYIWKTESCRQLISGNLLYEAGAYHAEIIATGVGYSQKSGHADLPVDASAVEKTISGTVTDQEDRPIDGAEVYLAKQGWSQWINLNQAVTDDEGRFVFAGLTPNCTYTLYWQKDGYAPEAECLKAEAGSVLTLAGEELGDGPLYLSVPGISQWKDAGVHTVIVTAPEAWTASTRDDWITAEAGSGSDELVVSIAENTTGAERSGSVTVTSGPYQVELTVVQQTGDSLAFNARETARETQSVTRLEQGEARDFLNFVFGEGAVKHAFLFWGWNVQESVQDYWRVLTGDTKGMTAGEITTVKKRLLAVTEERLLFMANGVLTPEEVYRATKTIREYYGQGFIDDYGLQDGVKDILQNIAAEGIEVDLVGSFEPRMVMDAELWKAASAGMALDQNNRRMNSAKQMLYELDENKDSLMKNLYFNEALETYLKPKQLEKFTNILRTFRNEVQ